MRKKIQSYEIDLLSFDEAIACAKSAIDNKKNTQVVTINPEMIELANKNEEFSNILKNAELVVPDGVGIKIALKLKGINQQQVRGVEFAHKMLELANEFNYKVALLGAKEEVISKAVENIRAEFNNLNIVYCQNGYFENQEEVIENLANSNPELVLVALGAPKQEIVISKLKNKLNGALMIGVGGTFDVLAGNVERAPIIWQKMGLEWLYRTIKQPERFKRIFPTLPIFMFKGIMEAVKELIFK